MTDGSSERSEGPPDAAERRRETLIFLALAFGIWPIVAVGVVGGFGFLVWMFQLIAGPPGPPAGY